VVLEILRKGRALKYDVHPIWVSGDNRFLQKADCLSKGIDSDNWSVGAEDFSNLEVRFGHFTIDLFAGGITLRTLSFRTRSFRPGHFVPSYISSPVISSPVISSPGHFVP
jgi:hypothetical protein